MGAPHYTVALQKIAALYTEKTGVPVTVVDVRDAHTRRLYERDLVLIRPDHHVAWRGDHSPTDAAAVIDKVRGAVDTAIRTSQKEYSR